MKLPTQSFLSVPQPKCVQTRRIVLNRGWTLIELLFVIAIMAMMVTLVIPAVSTIGKANSLTKAFVDISNTLQQARAYAMANNTYIYVGFFEADAGLSETARPQTIGIGRVYVAVVASKDGSRGYSNNNLAAIGKLQCFSGVHLVGKSIASVLKGMDSAGDNNLDLTTDSVTTFSSPIGTATPVCTFTKVVRINPSGGADVITESTNNAILSHYIQIGLQPTTRNQVSSNTANCAGIQIDSITGVVRTFRPEQP